MTIVSEIRKAKTTTELSAIVEAYLESLGEKENSRSETYEETANRLGDNVLEIAANRWSEIENGD